MANFIYKHDFLKQAKEQIKVYNILINDIETLKDITIQFNNKVLNKRIETALKKNGFNHYLKFFSQNKNRFTYEIYFKGQINNYIDHKSLYFDFVVYDLKEQRINSDETIKTIEQTIKSAKETIKQYQFCIDNIDIIIEETKKIQEQIRLFNNKIPFFARPYYIANTGIEIINK